MPASAENHSESHAQHSQPGTANGRPAQWLGRPAMTWLVSFLLIAALVFLRLYWALPGEIPVHSDAVRASTEALDHLSHSPPLLRGPPTSFGNFWHGTGWYFLVAGLHTIGFSMAGVVIFCLAMTSLAFAAFFLVIGRIWGQVAAVTSTLAATAYLLLAPDVVQVPWNPAAVPGLATGAMVCLLRAVETRRPVWYVATFVALSLLGMTYFSGLMFAPPALVVMFWFRPARRPLITLAVSFAVSSAMYILFSYDTFLLNFEALTQGSLARSINTFDSIYLWSFLAAAAAFFGVWQLWRRDSGRALAVTAASMALGTCLLALGGGYLSDRPWDARFVLVCVSPVALVVGLLMSKATGSLWSRWNLANKLATRPGLSSTVAPVLLGAGLWAVQPPVEPVNLDAATCNATSFADSSAVADRLKSLGLLSYDQVFCQVRGVAGGELLSGLMFDFRATNSPHEPCSARPGSQFVYVARVPKDTLSDQLTATTTVDSSDCGDLLVLPTSGAIDWSNFTLSWKQGRDSYWSEPFAVIHQLSADMTLGYPRLTGLPFPNRVSGLRYEVRYVLPDNEGHVVAAVCPSQAALCVGRITEVTGPTPPPELPADRVVLSGPQGSSGTLVIEYNAIHISSNQAMVIPPVLEFPQAQSELEPLIDALWTPLE